MDQIGRERRDKSVQKTDMERNRSDITGESMNSPERKERRNPNRACDRKKRKKKKK